MATEGDASTRTDGIGQEGGLSLDSSRSPEVSGESTHSGDSQPSPGDSHSTTGGSHPTPSDSPPPPKDSPDSASVPARPIKRTANSRKQLRRKTLTGNSFKLYPPTEANPQVTSPAKMADEPSTGSDVTPEVDADSLKLPRSESDVSMGSCNSDDGINDSITNMGELTTSVYNFLGQAASFSWGWVKSAVSHGVSLWYGDPTPPEEWHCDTASEESDLENDNAVNEALEASADLLDNPEVVKIRDKTYYICDELRTTEESYVRRLGILCMAKERASKIVAPEMAKEMFQNVETIQQFHKDYLLPQLQDRIDNWDSNPRIGDIMKKLVPFLKLYTEYVKNFERASQLVDTMEQKSSSFASLLKEVKDNKEYGRLRMQAHMLEPIQRVPRYELLLRDYLKKLPDNSPDRDDTAKAMELVSETASHFENMMKRDTRIMELMKIQNELDGPVNVVGAKREFIKRGKILKVSARTGKTSEKYAFLFSDMMLLCDEKSLAGLSSGHYKLRHIFELENAQVTAGNNLAIPNTFYIKSTKHAVEMATRTSAELDEWVDAIEAQMRDCTKGKLLRQTSKRVANTKASRASSVGGKAPVFVRMSDVSMCMLCAAHFSRLKRKQHCAGCGSVVCGKCSGKQMVLDYAPAKQQRVCDECFLTAVDGLQTKSKRASKVKASGVCLERKHLQLSTDSGKTWKAAYLALYDSKMLYAFKASQDVIPVTSTSLHESEASILSVTVQQTQRSVLRIKVPDKVYHIYDEHDEQLVTRWQTRLREMTSGGARDSMISSDSLSFDSLILDSQSVNSHTSLDTNSTADTQSVTSRDSGIHCASDLG